MTSILANLAIISSRASYSVKNFIQNNPIWAHLLLPILLSVIAGVIFWIIFSYIPDRKRKKQIRPVLFLDINTINLDMLSIFDIVMGHQYPAPSFFQEKIKSYLLTQEDLLLGLQNKCLNESYLYYSDIKEKMIVIGDKLQERYDNISRLIDRVFNFSHLLTNTEVLLLAKIRKEIEVYDLKFWSKRPAQGIVNGKVLYPSNSSMYFMSSILYNVYLYYIELDTLVDKNINNEPKKLQKLIIQKKYKKAISESNKISKNESKEFVIMCRFEAFYSLNKKEKAYIEFDKYLSIRKDIVSIRNRISTKMNDSRIRQIIKKHIRKDDIKYFFSVVKKEKKYEKSFLNQQSELQNYFAQKLMDKQIKKSK